MFKYCLAVFLALGLFSGVVFADEKEMCLACHGPFDSFISKSLLIETEGGMVNPHKPVPHDSKSADNFMGCLACHTEHTFPPPSGYKDEGASLEYCYSCHHNYQFEKCSSCHS